MSWPDEQGPDGDSLTDTRAPGQKGAAGIWLWPNALTIGWPRKSDERAAAVADRRFGEGMAEEGLTKQQLFCHLRSCGHSPAQESFTESSIPSSAARDENARTPKKMTVRQISALHSFKGLDEGKGASGEAPQTSAFGPTAFGDDKTDSTMNDQWNKVMSGIGTDTGSPMFIPAGAEPPKPIHNPTKVDQEKPSSFFPHGIPASLVLWLCPHHWHVLCVCACCCWVLTRTVLCQHRHPNQGEQTPAGAPEKALVALCLGIVCEIRQ